MKGYPNETIHTMQKALSKLTDQELLAEAKKMKSSSIQHALLIGFLIGIIIFSVLKSTWGFFTLIPLFFIYRLIKTPDNRQALKEVLKERNLS